jgi:hypothetical protein
MPNKCLTLKFRNAKLFRNDKKCPDYVSDINGIRKRTDEPQYVEPITVYQVANVLRVLFGERPIPSLRKVLFTGSEYYFDKANESLIRVDGHKRFNKSKQEFQYVTELLSTKKIVSNSYHSTPIITWSIVKRYIGDDNMEWFIAELSRLMIDPLGKTFNEVRDILLNSDYHILATGLKARMLSGLVEYIKNDKMSYQLTAKTETALIYNNGIENIIVLSGEILVPVSDKDLERLSKSKGCSTILDGGLVWIDSIKSYNFVSDDGFTKVCNISTEKY